MVLTVAGRGPHTSTRLLATHLARLRDDTQAHDLGIRLRDGSSMSGTMLRIVNDELSIALDEGEVVHTCQIADIEAWRFALPDEPPSS